MNPWKKTIKKIFPKIRYKSYLMNGEIKDNEDYKESKRYSPRKG